jgi:hypothetical protein
MSSFGLVMAVLYAGFMALMIGTWIYLLLKVGEISRNVGAIAGQLDLQSRSLASLAESVDALVRSAAKPKPEPQVPAQP